MRAVWSFWSKPFTGHHRGMWRSEFHHLLSWGLSFHLARRHYPHTALYTDDAGARLLVDRLGLDFTTVSTGLNALADHDPEWWALGKLYAYRAQSEPFVHVDSDVFLWNRLPPHVESASVFSQNPEHFTPGESYYRPEEFEALAGWLPAEWMWFRCRSPQFAECCGVLGGRDVEFLNYYARAGIRLIEHPDNQRGWARLEDKIGNNILFEQYLLSACIAYHGERPGSRFAGLRAAHLFESCDEAFDPGAAARVGYTHLIAGAKSDAEMAARLERRMLQDFPEQYERCRRAAPYGPS